MTFLYCQKAHDLIGKLTISFSVEWDTSPIIQCEQCMGAGGPCQNCLNKMGNQKSFDTS